MTQTIRLNDLQRVLLAHAARREDGSVIPLPPRMASGDTRIDKALASLLRRDLIEQRSVTDRARCWRDEGDPIGLFITTAGRQGIGVTSDEPVGAEAVPGEVAPSASAEVEQPPSLESTARSATKIGAVLALLWREDGATLKEMTTLTGWLPHTTRAALTGLRKQGHAIARMKRGETTCYHIAPEVQ